VGDHAKRLLAREAILLLRDGRADRGREQVGHQGGFARAGNAADDGQAAGGNRDIEALEVAQRSLLEADP
jgi:hypothetical protein